MSDSAETTDELRYCIALSLVRKIGPVNARKMLSTFENAANIFRNGPAYFSKWRIRPDILQQLKDPEILRLAEKEMRYMEKEGVEALTLSDTRYPERLKNCHDAPLLIYVKGKGDLNAGRAISIVGTRRSTEYGKNACRKVVEGLKQSGVTVVSGLALGIDTCAHRSALDNGLCTFAVLAHGLHRLYPQQNRKLAEEMQQKGGLVTEFPTCSTLVPGHFASRNRIVAGLTDATLVVESGITGGSLITADVANSYHRDVFAVPGGIGQSASAGCNWLIKQNKAALVESAEDILHHLSWENTSSRLPTQASLFETLSEQEQEIVRLLTHSGAVRIDEISARSGQTINRLASLLLGLEFKNVVKVLPGKIYALVN